MTPKRYSDYPPETQRAIDGIIAIGVRIVRRLEAEGRLDAILAEGDGSTGGGLANYSDRKGGETNGKTDVA